MDGKPQPLAFSSNQFCPSVKTQTVHIIKNYMKMLVSYNLVQNRIIIKQETFLFFEKTRDFLFTGILC